MSIDTLARRITELDQAAHAGVVRFDSGPPLRSRVAVLPSAFNPPTCAHLRLLEIAATVSGVGSTAMLLTTRNVDKGLHGASLAHRAGMLLSLAGRPGAPAVLVSNQARIPDQGRALRATWPGVAFDFVTGYDTLVRVFDDRYYTDMARELHEFFGHHRLIAFNRGQPGLEGVREFLRGTLAAPFRERIITCAVDAETADVSSTSVRAAIEAGQDTPGLAPEVAAYIQEHGLYRPRLS